MAAAAALIAEESNLEDGMDLLGEEPVDGEDDIFDIHDRSLVTSPILTGDVLATLGRDVFPQTALYGRVLSQHGEDLPRKPQDIRLFINSNVPSCGLICGVQGSGKSHAAAVLLESVLIQNARLGTLPQPLSALVFHFDIAVGGSAVQPCEAAYLASSHPTRGAGIAPPSVTVLVLPNHVRAMRRVYAGLPSVRVEPLHFAPGDISGDRLLALMKVGETTQMPLYMEPIMTILRSMEGRFDYTAFRAALEEQKFSGTQRAMLESRLALLDSCLNGGTPETSVVQYFRGGDLTIIDLASPSMNESYACGFFDMILGLFVEANINATGKLVVLDEAHKYLSETGSSSRLVESLLTVVRQQRHLGTRVVISTQEPAAVPAEFLDLCSYVIAHRFSSLGWLEHLSRHISVKAGCIDALFRKVVSLRTGEAILFSPNGLAARVQRADEDASTSSCVVPSRVGQGYLVVRSRLRITQDGGHSLLAVPHTPLSSRLSRPSTETVAEPPAPPVVQPAGNISGQPGSVAEQPSKAHLDYVPQADGKPGLDRAAANVQEGSSSSQAPLRLPAFLKQKWKAIDEGDAPPVSVSEAQISVDEQVATALQYADQEEEQTAEDTLPRDVIPSDVHRATSVSTSLSSSFQAAPVPIQLDAGASIGPVADAVQAAASATLPISKSAYSHLVRIVKRESICDWTKLHWLVKKQKEELGHKNLRRFIQACVDGGLVRRVDDTHIALPDTTQRKGSGPASPPVVQSTSSIPDKPGPVDQNFSQPRYTEVSDATEAPRSDPPHSSVQDGPSPSHTSQPLPASLKQKWKATDEMRGFSAKERKALLSVDEQVALALQFADEEEQTADFTPAYEASDAKPAEMTEEPGVDSDVQSLLVLLQTHATEGFPQLSIHYVMNQRLRHGPSGPSMKERIEVAIAHAETLGLLGVRRTAIGDWLYLPDAVRDDMPISIPAEAAGDTRIAATGKATAGGSDGPRADTPNLAGSRTFKFGTWRYLPDAVHDDMPISIPAEGTGEAGIAATGKATAGDSDGSRADTPNAAASRSFKFGTILPEEARTLANLVSFASGNAPPAVSCAPGKATAASTSSVRAAVAPPREEDADLDADSDHDADDDRAVPQLASASAAETDVSRLVTFFRRECAAGNPQLGLTYVEKRGALPGKKKLPRLRAAIAVAASRGLFRVHTTPLGDWLLAPGTVPRVVADPAALQADDFGPLLAELRGGATHRLKSLRKRFFTKIAACPYGTRPEGFGKVVERAFALGLIVHEGTGWGKLCYIRLRV